MIFKEFYVETIKQKKKKLMAQSRVFKLRIEAKTRQVKLCISKWSLFTLDDKGDELR